MVPLTMDYMNNGTAWCAIKLVLNSVMLLEGFGLILIWSIHAADCDLLQENIVMNQDSPNLVKEPIRVLVCSYDTDGSGALSSYLGQIAEIVVAAPPRSFDK